MSDNQPPKPPKPPAPKPPKPAGSTQPVKKETVRITLRSQPGEGEAPKPAAPAPPRPAGAPPKPGGPPKPAAVAPAPPAGAKTVPLTPSGGAQSQPVAPGTQPLPKATVKLQPTQPVSAPPLAAVQSAPVRTASFVKEDEDDEDEGALMPLAAIALVVAAALLLVQLFSWPSFGPANGDGWKLPETGKKAYWQDNRGAAKTDDIVLPE